MVADTTLGQLAIVSQYKKTTVRDFCAATVKSFHA
jgi:hypothetical protein